LNQVKTKTRFGKRMYDVLTHYLNCVYFELKKLLSVPFSKYTT